MKHLKMIAISAFTVLSMGAGTASFAIDGCITDCEPPPEPDPVGQNPGNGKPVGASPWDGITGNSANNNDGPSAAPMDGQRPDTPYPQPGGKGDGPSTAN